MPDFPYSGGGGVTQTIGANGADSLGVTITSTTVNTKGAWVEITAATLFECTGLHLYKPAHSLTGTAYYHGLIDIGIGANPNEVVKIADIPFSATDVASLPSIHYYFPVSIAAGERISARFQSSDATETIDLIMILESRGFEPSAGYGLSRTYGADTAISGGTVVDPGASANTKGGWTVLTASSEFQINELCVFVTEEEEAGSSLSDAHFLMDIGVGASTFEKIIIADLSFTSDASPDMVMPYFLGNFPVSIPPATRITANAQCTITNASDRLLKVLVIGFG